MLNTIDLFAGCGGLTDGFKQSGQFNMLAGIEWDKNAVATLRKRLKDKWGYQDTDERMVHFDIQRITELLQGFTDDEEYAASLGLDKLVGNNQVDVVIGGPPCQAYSIAGRIRDSKGMHDDYRNYLFESYMKVVEHFQPKACIFENVQGMLSAKPGGISIVERVTKAFDEAGYYITTNLKSDALFDTSDFGVPQKRLRLIIVAFKKTCFSNYIRKTQEFYSLLNSFKVERKSTVKDALNDLPKLLPLIKPEKRKSHYISENSLKIINHEPRYHNPRDIKIFKLLANDIKTGNNAYIHSEALKKLYTEKTGKISEVHKYHVLREHLPSTTIPAHLYKDGLRHIHPDPEQARTITVREAARIQTFADDFEFVGGNGASYKMIGNAVPPKFAKLIAKALKLTLEK